jgi:hypothetical protein
MRRAAVALLVTVVAVVLLTGFDRRPPRTYNPNSALRAAATPPALAREHPSDPPPMRSGRAARWVEGPVLTTPFSAIQVRAGFTGGRLTGVETILLSGDGPYTNALNARAEPILREEALRAGSADVDAVSGATSTSTIWMESLQGAIDAARG